MPHNRRKKILRVRIGARQGFFLLTSLLVTAGMSMVAVVTLTRALTEQAAISRMAATHQAFFLAEAAMDRAIADPRLQGLTQAGIDSLLTVDSLLFDHVPFGAGTYTVTVQDNTEPDGNPNVDTDQRIVLVIQGETTGRIDSTHTIQAMIQVSTGQPSPFDYAVSTGSIQLSGNAQLGDMATPASLYVHGSFNAAGWEPFDTTGSSDVWASTIKFYNPEADPLSDLCPNCADSSIFHGPPTITSSGVTALPPLTVDLNPYYTESGVQQGVDGLAYHRITANRTISCGTSSGGGPSMIHVPSGVVEGIIYVERDVNLTFSGACTVKGTIVHEGATSNSSAAKIIKSDNTTLTIDSTAANSFGTAFAPGVAILGGGVLDFSSGTIMITGFVTAGHTPGFSGKLSTVTTQTTITGGLIGIYSTPTSALPSVNGPGVPSITYNFTPWSNLATTFGNTGAGPASKILFQALPATPPGITGGGSPTARPTPLVWLSN